MPENSCIRRQSLLRLIVLTSSLIVLFGSIALWLSTLSLPARFVFLPSGDVWLGFRSHAGWLQWIEYAYWDRENTDYAWWSIPWGLILVAESTFMLWQIRSWRNCWCHRTHSEL